MNATAIAKAALHYKARFDAMGLDWRVVAHNAIVHFDRKGQGQACGDGWISARKKCSKKNRKKLAAKLKSGDKVALSKAKRSLELKQARRKLSKQVAADKGKKARDIPRTAKTPKDPKNITSFEKRVPTIPRPDLNNPDQRSAILDLLPKQEKALSIYRLEGSRTLVEKYIGKNKAPGVRIFKPVSFEGKHMGYSETNLQPNGKIFRKRGEVELGERPNMAPSKEKKRELERQAGAKATPNPARPKGSAAEKLQANQKKIAELTSREVHSGNRKRPKKLQAEIDGIRKENAALRSQLNPARPKTAADQDARNKTIATFKPQKRRSRNPKPPEDRGKKAMTTKTTDITQPDERRKFAQQELARAKKSGNKANIKKWEEEAKKARLAAVKAERKRVNTSQTELFGVETGSSLPLFNLDSYPMVFSEQDRLRMARIQFQMATRFDRKGQGKACGDGWISARKKCSKKNRKKLAAKLKSGDKVALGRAKRSLDLSQERRKLSKQVAADKGKKARDIEGKKRGAAPIKVKDVDSAVSQVEKIFDKGGVNAAGDFADQLFDQFGKDSKIVKAVDESIRVSQSIASARKMATEAGGETTLLGDLTTGKSGERIKKFLTEEQGFKLNHISAAQDYQRGLDSAKASRVKALAKVAKAQKEGGDVRKAEKALQKANTRIDVENDSLRSYKDFARREAQANNAKNKPTPDYQDKLKALSNLGSTPTGSKPKASPTPKAIAVSSSKTKSLKRDVEAGSFSTAGYHAKTASRLKTALERGDAVGVNLSEKSDYGAKVSLVIGGKENPFTKKKMKHRDIEGYFGVKSKEPKAKKTLTPQQRELARLKKAGYNVKRRRDSRPSTGGKVVLFLRKDRGIAGGKAKKTGSKKRKCSDKSQTCGSGCVRLTFKCRKGGLGTAQERLKKLRKGGANDIEVQKAKRGIKDNVGDRRQEIDRKRLEALRSKLKRQTLAGAGKSKGIAELDPSEIAVDPKRFQYKITGEHTKSGEVGSLRGVQKFDPNLSGILQAWKDPADGKTYVVNGHNRLALAKKLGADAVAVRYLDAPTPKAARAIGALTNIAEGRGNSLDAAKFFRDTGISRADLEKKGIPMQEKIATEGLAMSNLDDSLFRKTIDGGLTPARAAIIGGSGLTHAKQRDLNKLIESQGKRRSLTDSAVSELAEIAKSAETKSTQTLSLFGTETTETSTVVEKAKLQASIKRRLSREKKLFGTVSRGKAAAELARGGNTIDREKSQELSKGAAQALGTFDQMKNLSGPVSSALNEAAARVANGENIKKVERDIYGRILKTIQDINSPRERRSA